MKKIIDFAHLLISEKVNKEDICVDMTIGNGNDTLFLSKICKFVYGFDVQQMAIDNTNKLLLDNKVENYKLFLSSHENFDNYISDEIKAFIYNLGYLPKGDKSITTTATSTINSLKKALNYLPLGGIIVLVVYSGHEQGKIEKDLLLEYVKELDQTKYEVIQYGFINQINNPPFVIAIERK